MGLDWPCVGRAAELRQLRELVGGPPAAAVIAGPAGVGKTRLASEVARLAEGAGFSVVWATATRAAAAVPFGALAFLLPSDDTPAGPVGQRVEFLRRAAAAVVARGGGNPLLVVVDDAHLLDEHSATLMHQLVSAGQAFVVLTIRSEEPAPDPIMALWRDHAERIELSALPADAIGELMAHVLGGEVDAAAALYLSVRSQGNALFLQELLLGGVRSGSFVNDGGVWRLHGPLSPSQRLIELVEGRLIGLTEPERSFLEVLSVGEPLGPGELEWISGLPLAESLERQGFVVADRDRRRLQIRLAHPIYGDVLRSRIPALSERAVSRSLADAVEATGARRREDTLRVGTWRLEAGNAKPDLMFHAAKMARMRCDFGLAERLVNAALDAGAGLEARLLAAQLAVLQGRSREAEMTLAELAELARDDRDRKLIALANLDNALFVGRIEEGLRITEDAEAVIQEGPDRDEITARRAGLLLGVRGPAAAAEAAEPLLARSGGGAHVWASQVASYSFARLGRIQAALNVADAGYTMHVRLEEPLEWYPWIHRFFRCEALCHAGRLEEADDLAKGEYQQGLTEKSLERQGWFALQLAKMVSVRGHVASGAKYATEGAAIFRELGRTQFVVWCVLYQAFSAALAGDSATANETLAHLDELTAVPGFYLGVDLLLARAWAAVADGRIEEARDFLRKASKTGAAIGDRVGEASALHALARIGYPQEVVRPLRKLAAVIEGDLIAAQVLHAEALAGHDAARLESAAGLFGDLGADLLAAEASADAARVWAKGGNTRKAATASRQALELSRRCEGAATPSLQTLTGGADLTPAERRIARLAATGHANKEIARRLGISVRTVETHLQHAYRKLGIGERSQLTEVVDI